MALNKKKRGAKPKPRDAQGRIIGKNYLKQVQTQVVKSMEPPKPAPPIITTDSTDSDFLTAAKKIEAETADITQTQAPEIKPQPQPEKNDAPIGQPQPQTNAPAIVDWSELIAPLIDSTGLIIASKTQYEEMKFKPDQISKLSKTYSDLINALFPDLSALSPKEKAIVVAVIVTGSVVQEQIVLHEKLKKTKPLKIEEKKVDV